MKIDLKNRSLGFYLGLAAAVLALVGGIAYLIVYLNTADPTTGTLDRVFSYLTFGFLIGGAVLSLVGELSGLEFLVLPVTACYGVALAKHLVETAYPLADVFTKVPFFGGNPTIAVAFAIIIAAIAILEVVSAFMKHKGTYKNNLS